MANTNENDSNYWSTEKIEELLFKVEEEGLDYKSVDNPFHDGDPELKRSNLLVAPSILEGDCGWAPCEAIFCNVPTIVSDINVTNEL